LIKNKILLIGRCIYPLPFEGERSGEGCLPGIWLYTPSLTLPSAIGGQASDLLATQASVEG